MLVLATLNGFAQSDTLIVKGKIENLTLRQYRRASDVAVARVNALRADQEIVRIASLNADGSFEVALPLIYPQEECFLSYDDLKIPFLATKGIVGITIEGDSLGKSPTPFRFAGVNAAINHLHAQFEIALAKANLTSKRDKWPNKPLERWLLLTQERDQKWAFYNTFAKQYPPNPTLDAWVRQALWELPKAELYAMLTQPPVSAIPAELSDSLRLDTTRLLTLAKADFLRRFTQYAMVATPQTKNSLSVQVLSRLVLRYVPDIDSSYRRQLRELVEGKPAKMSDLNWINPLFQKQEVVLQQLTQCELALKQLAANYNTREFDFLKAALYVEKLHRSPMKELTLWYIHLRPSIQNPLYARSLDEIHHFENQDSTAVAAAYDFTLLQHSTTDLLKIEVKPDTWLAKYTDASGIDVWKALKKEMLRQPTYVVFWSNDEYGRRLLAESRLLKARIPALNIIYICDFFSKETLWAESVIKSKTTGLHLKLTDSEQNDFFVGEWRINRVPFCVLYDTSGKSIKRNAPLPADMEGWHKLWNKMFP